MVWKIKLQNDLGVFKLKNLFKIACYKYFLLIFYLFIYFVTLFSSIINPLRRFSKIYVRIWIEHKIQRSFWVGFQYTPDILENNFSNFKDLGIKWRFVNCYFVDKLKFKTIFQYSQFFISFWKHNSLFYQSNSLYFKNLTAFLWFQKKRSTKLSLKISFWHSVYR